MSNYDFSLTTFSPSGKLVQIEYALHAMSSGGTAIGIKAKDGVVLVTEKKLPQLMDADSISKISKLTDNIGMVYAGMGPDSRVLMKSARKVGIKYHSRYGESIPCNQMVKNIATTMQEYTQQGGVRPFGVSLLVASYDYDGPHLYQVDPSGSYFAWKATAIGRNMTNTKTFLEKRYSEEAGVEDAVTVALLALREGFDGVMDENNIEVAVVKDDKKFKHLTHSEIKEFLDIIA